MSKVINFEELRLSHKFANKVVTKDDRLKIREELFSDDYDFELSKKLAKLNQELKEM